MLADSVLKRRVTVALKKSTLETITLYAKITKKESGNSGIRVKPNLFEGWN